MNLMQRCTGLSGRHRLKGKGILIIYKFATSCPRDLTEQWGTADEMEWTGREMGDWYR